MDKKQREATDGDGLIGGANGAERQSLSFRRLQWFLLRISAEILSKFQCALRLSIGTCGKFRSWAGNFPQPSMCSYPEMHSLRVCWSRKTGAMPLNGYLADKTKGDKGRAVKFGFSPI